MLPVNRIEAAIDKFPSGFFFTIGCDCHCSIWPLWQVNVTDSMTMEILRERCVFVWERGGG